MATSRSPQFRTLLAAALVVGLVGVACTRVGRVPAPEDASVAAPPPAINGGRVIAPIEDYSPQPPVEALSPEEERARFVLQPGYDLEPVLTEPVIAEPMQIAFDGNGRLFVLEMRTYMQDADGTGELEPGSRISMHDDTDGDGVYDRHTVYVDSMVVTRFVMPFRPNSILTMESNTDEVYEYTDLDGDGTADERTLFATDFGRSGNIEHQQSSLMWALDNWMYSTYNTFRIRWTPDGVVREETGPTSSQWGVTQDDDGKVWFQGGASGVPGYFQFPIVYGNIDVDDELAEGFRVPYGLAGMGDYQPGPQASRPDGTLAEVTGAAGNDVVRGHRLPEELRGDYLYGEPVARIVRRIRPVVTEGLTQLHNVHQPEASEFIRSTDPLFRPVQLQTAPDGTVYIVDTYRGIIQEGNWTREGTHLRKKIEQYGFDEVTDNGRIWRLTHASMERDRTRPRMNEETPAELVRHLAHPNGWWRDTAQRLLVLHQDRSVAPALEKMARESDFLLARIHALWTLEGLGVLDAALVRELMADPSPRMRIQAARAGETLYKAGERSLAADYRALAGDEDVDVVIQAMLSLDELAVPEAEATIRSAMARVPARGVQVVGAELLERANQGPRWNPERYSAAQLALLEKGAEIYTELCAECHGENGRGTPVGDDIMAPSLAGSDRVQGHRAYVVKTLLHGLTGPIEGREYPGGIMVGMGVNDDAWIASAASFVRNAFGNEGPLVTPEYVARVRAATAGRAAPYTHRELLASLPKELVPDDTWKASASHVGPSRLLGSTAGAASALGFEGWTTGKPQEPGMWYVVELPEARRIAEIRFDSPTIYRGRDDDAPPPLETHPRAFRIEVSTDGRTWSAPVAEGRGEGQTTIVSFDPVPARFVRITQTGRADEAPWSMQMLRLFAAGQGE